MKEFLSSRLLLVANDNEKNVLQLDEPRQAHFEPSEEQEKLAEKPSEKPTEDQELEEIKPCLESK